MTKCDGLGGSRGVVVFVDFGLQNWLSIKSFRIFRDPIGAPLVLQCGLQAKGESYDRSNRLKDGDASILEQFILPFLLFVFKFILPLLS